MNIALRMAAPGLVLALLLISPTDLRAAAGDEHWDVSFGWAGTSNSVYALRWHQGKLYTGGLAPNSTNCSLNIWDGQQWSSLGKFTGGLVAIFDLLFIGDTLYAGGLFTNVDGVTANGLASWNGTGWASVGGFKGEAVQLATDGSNLYVTGQFTNNIGSTVITNIGYWDGNAWHPLGNGLGKAGDTINTLMITNGGIYAAGGFTNSGPLLLTNLAFWNGSAWTQVATPVNGSVQSIALNGTDLYASGTFTLAGSTSVRNIARWDGANWFPLGSGLNSAAFKLAVFGSQLCAAGSFTNAGISAARFATWNGTSWSAAGLGLNSSVLSLLATETNVIVGGSFNLAGGGAFFKLASWDGANWSGIGPAGRTNGASATVRAFATDGTNLYVGGSFFADGGLAVTNIASWDGTQWHKLGAGLNNTVTTLAINGTNLYAGGLFTASGFVAANHLARWDGFNWYPLASGIPSNVNVLATYGSDLLVGGNFQFNASDGPAHCLARWDGTNWWSFGGYSLSAAPTSSGVVAIAVQGNDVYVGGNFVASSYYGRNSSNVVRFDTFDWVPLAGGVNTNVNALAFIGNDLYAGGQFSSAGGVPASRIAMWNGARWSNLGSGVLGTGTFTVNALAAIGSNLYAAGTFTNAGGVVVVNRIAKWDGANWTALGNGITATPLVPLSTPVSLINAGSDLFVGGGFGAAGGKDSCNIARWNETLSFGLAPVLRLSNPSKSTPFSFALSATAVPSYVIESTTNLSTWTPIATNSASSLQFSDSNSPPSPYRLYRARSGP